MNLSKNHLIQEIKESDREWVRKLLRSEWGSTKIVTRGIVHYADTLPGFVAWVQDQRAGLLTYNVKMNELEITTLNALHQGAGIGRALVLAALERANAFGCSRVWVITTNENQPAVEFYQAVGFEVVAVHKGAVNESRKVKPEIPTYGIDGIPILDEIELEWRGS